MLSLLVFKEKLKSLYGRYDMFINPAIKFVLTYISCLLINMNIGYMDILKNPFIVLLIALACALLPYGAICWILSGFLLGHIYTVSLEMALITAVFLMAVVLLYYGFHPGDSYLLILVPLMFTLKVPYVIAILVGLGGGLISIIPVSCGVVLYYILLYVKQNAGALTNDASVDITQKYVQMINGVFSNKTMILMVVACAITILVVYIIHNLSIDYAWLIAIAAGVVTSLVVVFIGDIVYGVSISILALFGAVIASALIAVVYQFFVFGVDYSRTEYTQFEDDDYYYYVKAVPKMSVSAPDMRVQRINARKKDKKDVKVHEPKR